VTRYICFRKDGSEDVFADLFEFDGKKYSNLTWQSEEVSKIPYASVSGLTEQESLFEHLCKKNFPNNSIADFRLVPLENNYGEYFPRMYRPSFAGRRPMSTISYSEIYVKTQYKDKTNLHYQAYPIHEAAYSKSLNQLGLLKDMLVDLFRVVDPHSDNFDAFGHKIRNVMLLACTEVESQWKAVLRENEYYATTDNFNTNDYFKLASALRLSEYDLSLPFYPECPKLSPFDNWNVTQPTQSIQWYDAYNKVKHDREQNFREAKLRYAIEGVAAVVIVNIAQFGLRDAWREEIGSFFLFEKVPIWKFQELYNFSPKSGLKKKCYAF